MIILFEQKVGDEVYKVNYVDDKNLFAGFDMECSCCENPKHWIENSAGEKIELNNRHNHLVFTGALPEEDDDFMGVYTARIPLKDIITNELHYLVFSNCHNGYYAHGYEFGKRQITTEGYL